MQARQSGHASLSSSMSAGRLACPRGEVDISRFIQTTDAVEQKYADRSTGETISNTTLNFHITP